MKLQNTILGIALLGVFFGINGILHAQTPAGTVQVNEQLYVDAAPVSVFDWIVYMSALKGDPSGANPSSEFFAAMPDSTIFEQTHGYSFYPHAYSRVSEQTSLHMVGLTYEQIKDFCAWRTRAVNTHPDNPFPVEYTLPSKEDYKSIQQAEQTFGEPVLKGTVDMPEATIVPSEYLLQYETERVHTGNRPVDKATTFRCVAVKQ